MNSWLMRCARHLDRVHLPDTIGAGLAFLLGMYLLGHVLAWVAPA